MSVSKSLERHGTELSQLPNFEWPWLRLAIPGNPTKQIPPLYSSAARIYTQRSACPWAKFPANATEPPQSPNILPSLGCNLACSTHPRRNPTPVGTFSGLVGPIGWLWVAGWPVDSNAASNKPICCRIAGGWTFFLGCDLACGTYPRRNPTPGGTSRGPVGRMDQLWVAGWPLDCNAASRKPICPIAGGLIKFPPFLPPAGRLVSARRLSRARALSRRHDAAERIRQRSGSRK